MKTNLKGTMLAVIALAGVLGMTVATPAHAADWHRGGPPHHWHGRPYHPHYYGGGPSYVVASPPPVVYAPPPPSPGINLILPLHFH